jgi:MOSC domain-containing protein YiiM
MKLLSVNLGRAGRGDIAAAEGAGVTGIDKRPVDGPVRVAAPGPQGIGGSGLAGDAVCDLRYHGGDDQAVYAYAREDLDAWEAVLGRGLTNGGFGENLTTAGVDVSGALIGERWRVGPAVVLEVSSTRVPCRKFAALLRERGWVKRFTDAGVPGAYLRVIEPGEIRAGDAIEIVHRPDHEVSVSLLFRAMTTDRPLSPRVLAAGEALRPEVLRSAREWIAKHGGQ